MLSRVISAGLMGVDGFLVTVECDTGQGLNWFEVVGLAEAAVMESRVRMRSALINSDVELPTRRITINLAPADVPKRGTIYDLPHALERHPLPIQICVHSLHRNPELPTGLLADATHYRNPELLG